MSPEPEFWMDGDGTYWVDTPTAEEAMRRAVLVGIPDYCDESLIVVGQETTTLRDCPLDDCEGHPAPDPDDPTQTIYQDCPEYRRTVWRIEGMESDGLAFEPIEKALAEGRPVHVNDNLVVRDGQVHWADECWCRRCDPAPDPIAPYQLDEDPEDAISAIEANGQAKDAARRREG